MASTSTDPGQDIGNQRHNDYLAERDRLLKEEYESARNFDKYLVTLSSGALAVSVTFIKDVAPNPHCHKAMCVSWAAFGLSLVSVILALLMSEGAFGRQRDILDREYGRSINPKDKTLDTSVCDRNCFTTATSILTKVSAMAFVVGILFLIYFAGVNLKERSDSVKKIPQPPASTKRTTVATPKPPKPPQPRPQPSQTPQKPAKR